MIDQDIVQRIKVICIFLLQFYKVLTGTMMTLFVPQACPEISDGSENNIIIGGTNRICTIRENFENDEIYHQLTLYWNIISFFCFICVYILELKRENWAIKFLDIDNDKPDNSLKEIIIQEPKLDKYMDKLNKYYFY